MRIFNPKQAESIVTSKVGPMVLVFCTLTCKIDYHNGIVRYPKIADRNLYGCWQCGEDLTQGLNLARPEGDNNIYRINRTGRL